MRKTLWQRFLISLMRDLIIPWLTSLFFILLFILLIANFGLIIWPICVVSFIFLCVVRANLREQEQAPLPPVLEGSIADSDDELNESALMDRYGLSFSGRYYRCGRFHFNRLDEAISHARSERQKAQAQEG